MKKLFFLVVIFVLILVVTGCNKNVPIKTEYEMNEEALIDDLSITMISASILENKDLEVLFKIKNNRNNTITISPDKYFKLYDINQVQVPNIYQNDNTIIKQNETIEITLQYNITSKNIYEVLFYSGIVENNIKFTITNLDLE